MEDFFANVGAPIEVPGIGWVIFIVCGLLMLAGLGYAQSKEKRCRGIYLIVHSLLWALIALFGCGWANYNQVREPIVQVVAASVALMLFLAQRPGIGAFLENILGLLVMLVNFVVAMAISVGVLMNLLVLFKFMDYSQLWQYVYWSTLVCLMISGGSIFYLALNDIESTK